MPLAASVAREAILPSVHEEVPGRGEGATELPGDEAMRDLPPERTRREMVHEQEGRTLNLFSGIDT